MTTDPDLKDFGRAIRFYREDAYLTQLDVAARGGPSNTTQTKIENGEPPPPSPATLRKLDVAFGWPQGSARLLLREGRSPIPISESSAAPRIGSKDLENLRASFRGESGEETFHYKVGEIAEMLASGAQPITDFTTEELLLELLRRTREQTDDQAQEPRTQESSTEHGGQEGSPPIARTARGGTYVPRRQGAPLTDEERRTAGIPEGIPLAAMEGAVEGERLRAAHDREQEEDLHDGLQSEDGA